MTPSRRPLEELEQIIADRATQQPKGSYTTSLLAGGVDAIGIKIIEEAAELVESASEPGEAGRAHVIHEAADLIYHVLVLLRHSKVALDDVETELASRFGVSGLDEKAGRESAE